ncbi:hypothetical protein [Xanthomonas sp. GPE 39]|uniref:hypothetical protein n=1 Tax=Xanthomonas sp. GPE 39 TaxID=1583099 RepID=UPI000ACB7BF2|nr:hypothetical protein [Xanthomonas sp. GPE 39]
MNATPKTTPDMNKTLRPVHDVDRTPASAKPTTRSQSVASHAVFQSPLSAGDTDNAHVQLRAQRARRMAQLTAIGSVAALATVALIAWRRMRR